MRDEPSDTVAQAFLMDRADQREIRRALGRGDVLVAYDRALQALDAAPDDLELKYLSVLALVRSGAPRVADGRYQRLELDRAEADGQLGIDIGALAGRIAKDRALAASDPTERQAALERAIAAYQTVADRTGDAYPAVNVAALSLWAGDILRARQAAETVLNRLSQVPEQNRDYWHFATSAEAHLVTGDVAAAAADIAAAAARSGEGRHRNWHDLAVTANQIRRSCRAHGFDEAILEPLGVPPIVVYVGEGGVDLDDEPRLAKTIDESLVRHRAVMAFGGLRAGFEIAFAEAVIARDAELNVVLPFPTDLFVAREVEPFGAQWVSRFDACLSGAASVRFATDHGFSGQAAAVRYARRLAMGHAILHARRLDTSSILIVGAAEEAGDCSDTRAWTATGRDALVLPCAGASVASIGPDAMPKPSGDFVEVASLFGDFMGFGRLSEDRMGDYAEHVLGGIADVLDRYGDGVKARNSWGDAVVAQFYDVRLAARCAIDLQAFLRDLRKTDAAPGIDLQMRIGLHYGPVQKVRDRVQGRDSYLGTHVVRAARIEPVAIPGMIYVSEPFAAALAVDARDDLVCDYLGRLDAAKGFGRLPLYALRNTRDTLSA